MGKHLKLMALVAGVVLCVWLATPLAFSQQERGTQDDDDSIVRKQEEAERELQELERLMQSVAEKLEERDSESAQKLRDAWKATREKLILEDMRLIKKALRDKELYKAYRKAENVARNLLEILAFLASMPLPDTDELSRLENYIRQLRELERQQKKLLDRAKKGEHEHLVPEQVALKEKTGLLGDRMLADRHKSVQQVRAGRLVHGAEKDMNRAQKKLRRNAPGATDDQKAALVKLRKAIEELEERWRELKNQQLAQTRQDIIRRLRELLEEQGRIYAETVKLDTKKLEEGLAREERIELRRMSRTQLLLSEAARKLAKQLEEEKSPVFAATLLNIASDMKDVADLLRQEDTGNYTRQLEQEIIAQLKRLIEVLLDIGKKPDGEPTPEPPDGPQPPRPPREPRLVPPIAELKLLRKLESDIYRKTREVHRAVELTPDGPNFMQKKIINRLAHRQARLAGMIKELRESLKK